MENGLFEEALRLMKKYNISEQQVAERLVVPVELISSILNGRVAPGDYRPHIYRVVGELSVPLIVQRTNEALEAMNKKNTNDGKETKKMAAKEFLTDEQVEQEIERLTQSPLVALARREQRLKYRRRQYLYQLRDLEKKGRALEKAGINMEVLNAMYQLEDYDEPC